MLAQFVRGQSQDAFTELVRRHLNLVYSAAVRQVRSPQLAEEVSQSVFANLARNAERLAPDTILSAWLFQVTRNAAIDMIRREASRQAREQLACQMNELNAPDAQWNDIAPMLDEAMEQLDSADRSALLLRYFENKSLREVGAALGASEDAAQKRVSRAIERLREHFASRKVSVGASSLIALLSANAMQAAPAGLAASLAAVAAVPALSAIAISNSIAITMTATQKIAAAALVALGAIVFSVYEAREASVLRARVDQLQAREQEIAALSNQVRSLSVERDSARNQVAALTAESAAKKSEPAESLKLRGEVSRLRKEKTELGATSGLSKATASPEARKMMREQQKFGMAMLYKDLGKIAEITPEQGEKLSDLLADHIMDNVENVTVALREKMTPDQLTELFGTQEEKLNEKVRELIGEDGLSKYRDYTKDLLGSISAQQFKAMMTGENDAKEEKARKMAEVLRAEARALLAENGLPPDYQILPMLNFRNIASESEAEKSLKLLDSLYVRAAGKLGGVLSEEELKKLEEFRAKARENSQGALVMNRNLMAPIGN